MHAVNLVRANTLKMTHCSTPERAHVSCPISQISRFSFLSAINDVYETPSSPHSVERLGARVMLDGITGRWDGVALGYGCSAPVPLPAS